MIMTLSAAERVANGVELLDSTPAVPDNWRALINLNSLTLSSVEECVLGQLAPHTIHPTTGEPFRDYCDLGQYLIGAKGWSTLGDNGEYPDAAYGFISASGNGISPEMLVDAWRAELTEALGPVA